MATATASNQPQLDLAITIGAGTDYLSVGVGFTNQWCAMDSVWVVGTSPAIKGTRITQVNYAGSGYSMEIWQVKGTNIPTGAQTVRCRWSSAGNKTVGGVLLAFTGVNQTTPSKSVATASGSAASVSRAVTCNTGDIMVGFTLTAFRTITGTGGTTALTPYATPDNYIYVYGLYEVAGASDKTISWNLSSSNTQSNATFAVQP